MPIATFPRAVLPGLLAAGLCAAMAGPAAAFEFRNGRFVPVQATPIERFSLFGGNRAGDLTFLGGLELKGRAPFTGLSGLERLPGRDAFLAVTDRGHWAILDVTRGARGTLAGVRTTIAQLPVDTERRRRGPDDEDAEAIRLLPDGSAVVSLERRHRILRYDPKGRRTMRVPHLVPDEELRRNKGFEALAVAPIGSPLGGAGLVIAEHSIDENGDHFAAVLSGSRKGIFKVKRTDEFDVTDADFLPDGDLIVLERSYLGRLSLRIRLRRIDGDTIRPGAVVDGPTLMTAGLAAEIDNMEGLAIYEDERGTVLTLVSDDNGSFLQRTLLMEFLLEPGVEPPTVRAPDADDGAVPVPRMRPTRT